MPALTTCPICGFDGPHGFGATYGGIMYFYHSAQTSHTWYKIAVNPAVNPTIGKLVKDVRGIATYLITSDLSEAFELGVVPTIRNDPKWIAAVRAEIAGKRRLSKRLFAEWNKAALA